MKKALSIAAAATMLLGAMSMSVSANRGLSYHAPYGTPTIDGVADEIWSNAEWTQIDLPYNGDEPSVCSARAKIMHDDKYIYVLAELTDATVGSDQDLLEFYLDEDSCKEEGMYCDVASQWRLGLDGTTILPGINCAAGEDAVTALQVTTSADGYVMEFAIAPITAIPDANTPWGLEFMYNDSDEDGNFIGALRWNVDTLGGDVPPYQEVANFGDLYFDAYVEPVVEPIADETPAESGDSAPVDAPVTAPTTADAGIAVAALAMAAAAGVVLSKKR